MNETLLTWIVFLVAFSGMIILHELGHFFAARLVKVEVEEFGLGLPTPGAITLFTWQGTRFTLNWLPLGGFVRPKGENDPNVEGGLAASAPWKRLVVLFAGPMMNLLTALILFSIIINMMGGIIVAPLDTSSQNDIMVTQVTPNGPADNAGLMVGDVILSGNGEIFADTEEASNFIKANPDTPILFAVLRDGQTLEFTITPLMNESMGRPLIGVNMCTGCEFQPIPDFTGNVEYSFRMVGQQINLLGRLAVGLIKGTIPAEQGRLIGMKGIFDIMEQSVSNDVEAAQTNADASAPFNPFNQPVDTLFLLASLSISLGVFNLFPFPALDGGRIIFVLPELIFRRRVPHEFENLVHGLGMTFLLIVMIYVNVKDFIDPVTSAFP